MLRWLSLRAVASISSGGCLYLLQDLCYTKSDCQRPWKILEQRPAGNHASPSILPCALLTKQIMKLQPKLLSLQIITGPRSLSDYVGTCVIRCHSNLIKRSSYQITPRLVPFFPIFIPKKCEGWRSGIAPGVIETAKSLLRTSVWFLCWP